MNIQLLKAEKMVAGGDCMGKIGGKNVFVPYAIPGETYEVEITKSFRDYDKARITAIKEKSPHRVEPFCKYYGICGGCSMQHIDAEFQTELRKSILREAFSREKIEAPEIGIIGGSDRGYRARIQLTDGGFNARESNEIIAIDSCPIATPEINAYLSATKASERPRGRIQIFGDSRVANEGGILIAGEPERTSGEIKISGAGERRKSKVRAKKNVHFKGTMQSPANICTVNLCGKTISFDARGFFQSNLGVLEKAVGKVTENMGGNAVLDLYSGCGTFSVFLADRFGKTTLVEHNRDAIVYAEQNMRGKAHESYGQSCEKFVAQNAAGIIAREGAFDAAVVDPPRQGMESAVSDWLARSGIGQIRSVSCNASTHARDAKKLIDAGYTLEKLFLLDFYPQTAHTESLAFFGKL